MPPADPSPFEFLITNGGAFGQIWGVGTTLFFLNVWIASLTAPAVVLGLSCVGRFKAAAAFTLAVGVTYLPVWPRPKWLHYVMQQGGIRVSGNTSPRTLRARTLRARTLRAHTSRAPTLGVLAPCVLAPCVLTPWIHGHV